MFGWRFGDVVNVVGPVGIGEFLGGSVVDLGEDERGEGGRLGRGGGRAFCENGGVVGYARARGGSSCEFGCEVRGWYILMGSSYYSNGVAGVDDEAIFVA